MRNDFIPAVAADGCSRVFKSRRLASHFTSWLCAQVTCPSGLINVHISKVSKVNDGMCLSKS